MIKIEAPSLEQAYRDAATSLSCSITELNIEVVQAPSNGFLGMFKKSAIIVATSKLTEVKVNIPTESKPSIKVEKEVNTDSSNESNSSEKVDRLEESKQNETKAKESSTDSNQSTSQNSKRSKKPKKVNKTEETKQESSKSKSKVKKKTQEQKVFNDTIMPESFVSTQDDEDYDMDDINFTADYDEEDETEVDNGKIKAKDVVEEIDAEINKLFDFTCFNIDKVEVSAYDDETLLIEFKGEDAALLIGKEGYRYKALSYMIFNWINTKYQLQLRLEIAEFLKNQEESVGRYLVGVKENIDRDGRAQTKILDGVLVQIALKELRDKYPNKYVAIRSTRDGLKFIIVNDYHN